MKTVLLTRRLLITSIVAFMFSFIAVISTPQTTHAGRAQPANQPEADGQINDLCPKYPAVFAAYVSDLSFDYNSGVATYTINIRYRGCGDTRAFAVVGNDAGSRQAICPMVGQYGVGNTFDCLKYTSNPRFSDGGGLSCPAGKNEQCIVPSEFSRIEKQENRPGGDIAALSLKMSAKVPAWDTAKNTSGSHEFGSADALCAFYKAGGQQLNGQMCQDLYFKVSWTAPWTIRGESYIKNSNDSTMKDLSQGTISAKPGDLLNWYHDMRNNGPGNVPGIAFGIDRYGFQDYPDLPPGKNFNAVGGAPAGTASGPANALIVYEYASFPAEPNRPASPYTKYEVTQDDVGNTLCQKIAWQPGSSSDGNRYTSTAACAEIPYKYTIDPSVSSDVTNGSPINTQGQLFVSGGLDNKGPTKSRPNLQWQMSQVVYAPNATAPDYNSPVNGSEPCQYFGRDKCKAIGSSTIAEGVGLGKTGPYPGGGFVEDEVVGTKICFVMSVRQYSESAENWRHSPLACRIVSKSPKIQVKGGDVVVGKGTTSQIVTSITRKQQGLQERFYGSWGEYAITASGPIYGMASGAGYTAEGITDGTFCKVSYLTLTNAGADKCSATTPKGLYSFGAALPPISSYFTNPTDRGANPSIDVATQSGVLTGSGTIEVRASKELGPKQVVIINATKANVVIKTDIKYTGSRLNSVNDIPQVVIIGNNITIDPGVKQVDAWLIASGTNGNLSTCSGVTFTDLKADTCNERLTVNGPVAARKLFLYRTAGSGKGEASNDPAEVFNLRADAYVWAAQYAASSNRIQTASTTELPPRF